MKSAIVGIDLGTTNSAVAYLDESGRPVVLRNAEEANITPSVVQIRADGTTVVGATAKEEVALEAANTAQFFKRDMGTNASYSYQGRPWTPLDLSAEVLAKLKRDGEAALGCAIDRAIVTVPAYFQDAARLATRAAGAKAGLDVVEMINEPTAAALAYGLKRTDEQVVMVYDLGGGTFDVTLVRISGDGIDVIATDGNHRLGGKDWDDRLVSQVCDEFRARHGVDPLDDPFAFQDLLVRAEDLKKALSQRARAAVTVNYQGKMDRFELTREQFEDLTRDLLTQTEMLMTRVLDEAAVPWAALSSVLMVGGSTRMPMCGDLIRRLTGKPPNVSVNPDECVTLGAALKTAEYREATAFALPPSRISDVMSHSMGMLAVSADGERYVNSVLIPKNRPIPCRAVRPYQVGAGVARAGASIYVTQGEGDDPTNCSFVGRYVVTRGAAASGNVVVDIAYEYDRSGVVGVTARDRATGEQLAVVKEPVPADMAWVSLRPAEARVEPKTVLLAVDLSGSMRGEPLEAAKSAVGAFIAESDLANTAIGLLSFADAVSVDLEPVHDAKQLHKTATAWHIGSKVGGGNSAQPFDSALDLLKGRRGARFLVVLTDGAWMNTERAVKAAQRCHKDGIQVVSIGFGSARQDFLQRIANSEEAAFMTQQDNLSAIFGEIAQGIVEVGASNPSATRSGLGWLRSR